jgi:hypothetical protein
LIGVFWAKYARRIFAIVSITSIPNLVPASLTEATVDPPSEGSRLDADHPKTGSLFHADSRSGTRVEHERTSIGIGEGMVLAALHLLACS